VTGGSNDRRRREPATAPVAGGEDAPDVVEVRESGDGVVFAVRVKPRASRDAIGGVWDGALVVRLTAPPVEGAANAALARLLGRALGVAPSAVRIVGGATSRTKRVAVSGVGLAAARNALREESLARASSR
jgi:uncharacterized protein (TIGR00251 family)